MKKKPILLKDFIMGIFEYPIYLLAGGLWNSITALIVTPFYISYLRMKGTDVFYTINPNWSLSQIREFMGRGKK